MYDQEYLKLIISTLENSIDDLDKWSVHNEDEFNEQVESLRIILNAVKKKV
jgi:hypothetical protein